MDNDTTKAAALYLLSRGLATQAEVAALARRSRQIVSYWAKDVPRLARRRYLARHWQAALARAAPQERAGGDKK